MTIARTKKLPPWEELLDRFEYVPHTGQLIRKPLTLKYFKKARRLNSWNARYAGTTAGSLGPDGYVRVAIDRKYYGAHRLIWKWVTGEEPGVAIDHLNGKCSDNRFENLRSLDELKLNQRNTVLRKTNTSGFMGVSRNRSRWYARVYDSDLGKTVVLGTRDTPEEAYELRKSWEKTHQFTARHGQSKTHKR